MARHGLGGLARDPGLVPQPAATRAQTKARCASST
jgi:hypothetical protein